MDDRDREYLMHMLRYAETAVRVLGPLDAAGLVAAEEKLLAVSRCLQNVGEAAIKLSEAARSQVSGIPWRQVIGMRHHLVHAYEDINIEVLVTTIHDDLPPLITHLRRALEEKSP
jgi:uncharacterized protein with HEPN domain